MTTRPAPPFAARLARVALFLVSDYSTAMTGAILDANGGEFIAV